MGSKILKPYKGFSIEKSWEERPDGNKHNIIYKAYMQDKKYVSETAKTLPDLKEKIDSYKHDKWAVFGEYGGYFSNLKHAKQCAREASKTEEYDYEASIYNMHDGLYYIDYKNGKCVRDCWTTRRRK